jgi:hypothetical protein
VIAALVAITTALLHGPLPAGPIAERAEAAAADLELALAAESPQELRDRDRRLAWVFAYLEGGWYVAPPGSSDHGASCGTMQTWAGWSSTRVVQPA